MGDDAVNPAAKRRPLLAGLTLQRIGSVTMIALVVAASMVWFFENEFLDLLVSTLCVGWTTMLLFTMASNLSIVQSGQVAREAAQIVAVIAGSALGTVVTGVVKGRPLDTLLTERLSGFVATSGLGIGFGCVVVAVYFYRERSARMRAEMARMEAEFDASRAREEKNLLGARLQLLQAQVEPHFLFNTLANVQHLTNTDPVRASEMLGSLIRYLRASLPQMREQASTIAREAAMVQAYLEIQRVRMGDRLAFTIDIPATLSSEPMLPMMLISLVENAVKHGIDPLAAGGRIDITATSVDGVNRVVVADTGAGLSEHTGIGIGLGNIRERLATLYGSTARLDLYENEPRGVVAAIEWPSAINGIDG
jgi:sensor histidine kinase YesM